MDRDLLRQDRSSWNVMFPFFSYSDHYNENNFLNTHWHDEFEFMVGVSGNVKIQVESQYYSVKAGEAVFINSGEIHAAYSLENSPGTTFAMLVNPSMLYSQGYDILQNRYFGPISEKKLVLPTHIKGDTLWEKSILQQLFELINDSNTQLYGYELLVKSRIYQVFYELVKQARPLTINSKDIKSALDTERLKKVLTHIQENYSKKITINDLASLINMSEGHFGRFFKRMVNRSPIDYINYYRTSKAAMLLENEEKKEIEIALDVGFENFSYFISIFKNYVKCTPSEYRKRHLKRTGN